MHAADAALPRGGREAGPRVDHQPRRVLVVRVPATGQVGDESGHDQGLTEFEGNGQRGGVEDGVRRGELDIFISSSTVGLSVDFHALNRFFSVLWGVGGCWCLAG